MSLNCTLTNSNSMHILQLKFFNVKKIEVGIGVGKINTTEALITWSLQSNGRGRQIKSITQEYTCNEKCEERDELLSTGGRWDTLLCSFLKPHQMRVKGLLCTGINPQGWGMSQGQNQQNMGGWRAEGGGRYLSESENTESPPQWRRPGSTPLSFIDPLKAQEPEAPCSSEGGDAGRATNK